MYSRSWGSLNSIGRNILAFSFAKIPFKYGILKRLEVGVFFFCWRRSLEAQKNGMEDLAAALKRQAKEEYNHAQLFQKLDGGEALKTPARKLFDLEVVGAHNWGNFNVWGQVDGMSRRHLVSRVFFGNKRANEYSWDDSLAYMAVLESFQSAFYQHFWRMLPEKEAEIVKKITWQEMGHANDLQIYLQKKVGIEKSSLLIKKWNRRLGIALPFVIFDILGILASVVMTKIKDYGARIRLSYTGNQ